MSGQEGVIEMREAAAARLPVYERADARELHGEPHGDHQGDQHGEHRGDRRDERDGAPRRRLWTADGAPALAAAVLVGLFVRAYHVLSRDFPLNDGGMFYQMTRDLQHAHYVLPTWTAYNHSGIPFAYSPLGFYLAGLLDDLTPLSLLDVFRWLPLAATSLTIGVFVLLARRLVPSRSALVIATAAFGLLPRSFLWPVMGGGVTRSLGFLFALLTLERLHRLCVDGDRRAVPAAAFFGGLTLLSHLGTATFVVVSAALLLLAHGRNRRTVGGALLAGVGGLLVAAPWWATVLLRHGLAPFRDAGATGGWAFAGLTLEGVVRALSESGLGTGEPVLAPIGMLAVIGFFYAYAGGAWFLPTWWLTITLFDTRQGSTFSTVPIAILAAIGLCEVLLPALWRRATMAAAPAARRSGAFLRPAPVPAPAPGGPGVVRRHFPAAVVAMFGLFAFASALMRGVYVPHGLSDLTPLSRPERDAMYWLGQGTPADARVLVVANTAWQIDRTSEWLPVLAGRVSVATVQGTEWLPHLAFQRRERQFNELQQCAFSDSTCLDRWSRATRTGFTHVYVPRPPTMRCCDRLVLMLMRDRRYRRIFDGPGAVIFERRGAR
jgi:hypothetical protein